MCNTSWAWQKRAVHRSYSSELTISSSLQGLPFGKNKLFLYEIEKNGIPGKYPAVNTSVDISSQPQTHSKLIIMNTCPQWQSFVFTQLQKHTMKHLLISLCPLGINKFVYCHLWTSVTRMCNNFPMYLWWVWESHVHSLLQSDFPRHCMCFCCSWLLLYSSFQSE